MLGLEHVVHVELGVAARRRRRRAGRRGAPPRDLRIVDGQGALAASGTVGGRPMDVTPGAYRVEVELDRPVVYDDVRVGPGDRVELEVPGPA